MYKATGPQAFFCQNGNLFCCINGSYIYMNTAGVFQPQEIEIKEFLPIGQKEWARFIKESKTSRFFLNHKQIELAKNALEQRKVYFESEGRFYKRKDWNKAKRHNSSQKTFLGDVIGDELRKLSFG